MKRRICGMALSAAMLASAVLPVAGAGMVSAEAAGTDGISASLPLQAWYDEPAPMTEEGWEQNATQLGNGFLGAMVFGGVATDKIQVNEHTLWSGGPGANEAYDGGATSDLTPEERVALRTEIQEALSKVSQAFEAYIEANPDYQGTKNYSDFFVSACGMTEQELTEKVNKLLGKKTAFGSYQTLGDIYITDVRENDNYTDYKRVLDLNNGTAQVTYKQDGVDYTRDYFVSNPGNIMVIRLTASQKGKLSRAISLDSVQPNKTITGDIVNNTLTMTGRPSDHKDYLEHLEFAQQVKVVADGGSVLTLGDTVYVDNADSITIYMTAGTNYIQQTDGTFDFFSDEDPLDGVEERIAAAVAKGYEAQLAEHQADYKALFDAMQLNIGGLTTVPDKPTDELMAGYDGRTDTPNTAQEDLYLENLYFQFGRYLLIASSREGSLPANLQGIWADGLTPPWNADYHLNINMQMNYWLAETTNLSECHLPAIDYINSLVAYGEMTAEDYYGVDRGWVAHHENNIWGYTAPGESGASYAPESAAWACQDIWEYYQFNQDKEFLAENYDTLLGAALFWVDNLVEDANGKLVASPSYSPEHGPYSEGATYVQSVVWEIFNEVIQAAEVLGKTNDADVQEIVAAQEKLLKPTVETSIGHAGQFLEWQYETRMDNDEDKEHRHVNHLYGLHPGTQVVAGRSEEDDLLVEAMKQTLINRGDGGTGWSKAWKINFWARLRDGDHARTMVSQILKESTADNLFDLHPPFQIDGNFGATAGIAEMLLQSQGDAVELLAAMPDNAWDNGTVTGMKARGNVEVDMAWTHNTLRTAVLHVGTGNDALKVKGDNIASATLTDSKGNEVEFTADGNDTIIFAAEAGETYTVAGIVNPEGVEEAKAELEETIADAEAVYNQSADKTSEAVADLKAAIDQAKAVLAASDDYFTLVDAADALAGVLEAFNAAYDIALTVSPDSGLYKGFQTVTMTTDSDTVDIRYTLDGTTPTATSPLYNGMVALPYGATTLKAAAFRGDTLVGTVVERRYWVNDETDLAVGAAATETSTPIRTGPDYPVTRITDGSVTSDSDRWATSSVPSEDLMVEIDLKKDVTFDSYLLHEFCEPNQTDRVTSLKVEYWDGAAWVEIRGSIFEQDNIPGSATASKNAYKAASFEPVTAQKVRLTMRGDSISIYAFSLFNHSAPGDKTELDALVAECEGLRLSDYLDTEAFEAALAAAKAVQADGDATVSDVNVAYYTLLGAKNALVKISDEVTPGDVNGKDGVTSADALLALQAATQKITLEGSALTAADVDGVEGVTSSDALMILQAATGKITLDGSGPADPGGLPTATKEELKAAMDEEFDLDWYSASSAAAYEAAMDACELVYNMQDVSGENIYRAMANLQSAKEGLTNVMGTFSLINGTHTVLNADGDILYADWKTLDQHSVDVSENRGDMRLQLTIKLQSDNPDVEAGDIWKNLTVKLRSSDRSGVAGDPDGAGNTEHNYGWDFYPDSIASDSCVTMVDDATMQISIPLDRAKTNSRGVMDWSDVQRIIVQCPLSSGATGDPYQYSMEISGARIVNAQAVNQAKEALAAKVDELKDVPTTGYDADLVAVFTQALADAQALLNTVDEYTDSYDVNKALVDLTNAYTALTA